MTDALNPDQFPARLVGLLGRLPVKPVGSRFPLNWANDYLVAPIPAPVYPIDVTGGITDFGMLGNDQEGDCGEAGIRHVEMTTGVAAGSIPSFTTQEALDEYHAFTGGQDTGVNLADFLLWLFNRGRIKAFAPVDHHNVAQADALMAEFWGLYCGVSLTPDAQSLFGQRQPWTTADGQVPDANLGHCIEKVKADGTADGWVTWAAVQDSTAEWTAACIDEIWLVVTSEEELSKFTPDLIQHIQSLHGQVAPTAPTEPMPVPSLPSVPSDAFIAEVEAAGQAMVGKIRDEIARLESEIDRIESNLEGLR